MHIARKSGRFVVRVDEKLTAFVELESAIVRPAGCGRRIF
jgi:hypothetical protein